MHRDFKVDQGNALIQNGILYDLRNLFVFQYLTFSENKKVIISFRPDNELPTNFSELKIAVTDASYISLSDGFGTDDIHELDEIGFKSSDDLDHDFFLTEEQSKPTDHLFFSFSKRHFIRVFGISAVLKTEY